MSPTVLVALIGGLAIVCTALGGVVGAGLTSRAQKRVAEASEHTAEVTAAATVKATERTAQDRLIDQLQEELGRYRDDNDKRVDRLEQRVEDLTAENRGYRAFIGVQRDHMAEHGIPLPPYPSDLPR
ncbi:hypothetical protein [Leucobacter luti]|uniref:hypothetical protein n=1 Tax=Leucobacter luti TaxID=340320 RepID=UPI001C68CE49|nr:hypothetical protein [Leucobacter luti]QYM76927.1 hypothetical protein K1X41_05995 [Leucobacter luti]